MMRMDFVKTSYLASLSFPFVCSFFITNGTNKNSKIEESPPIMSSPNHKSTIRILMNRGDNMLGRAVQLTFPVQAPIPLRDSTRWQVLIGIVSSTINPKHFVWVGWSTKTLDENNLFALRDH